MGPYRRISFDELHLLDLMDKLSEIGRKERRIRPARAVNTLLQAAMKVGYSIDFGGDDGMHFPTPSGLVLWFPTQENEEGIDILVVDKQEDFDSFE
jgi:hypothetical protein